TSFAAGASAFISSALPPSGTEIAPDLLNRFVVADRAVDTLLDTENFWSLEARLWVTGAGVALARTASMVPTTSTFSDLPATPAGICADKASGDRLAPLDFCSISRR